MTYHLTLILFTVSMVAAYALSRWWTDLARRWALRRRVLSQVTARSAHTRPTPRLGGVGLAFSFGLVSALFLTLLWLMPHRGAFLAFNPGLVRWVGLGWLLMFAIGLLDDLFDLPAMVKLALMAAAALAPAWGGSLIFNTPSYIALPTAVTFGLDLAVTVLWILFFTNGFNFMDGMDGFAANFARAASLFMFAIVLGAGLRNGSVGELRAEAFLLPILALACWGFLHWNRPPARVFMGDAGSLSLGFLLASYVILGYRRSLGLTLPPVSSFTILLPFIFDVALTLARRARMGQNLLVAHREHLYQRLLRGGLSHAAALRINRCYFFLCGAAALAGSLAGGRWGPWAGAALALGAMLDYAARVRRHERRARGQDGKTAMASD